MSHQLPIRTVLLLAVCLVACTPQPSTSPTAPATPLPTRAATLPPPTPLPTRAAAQTQPTPIPGCTFPLPQAAPPVGAPPPLAAYHFTEPRVVQTGGLLQVAEWLPDNQRLLITRAESTVALEVLDITSGTTTPYGTVPTIFNRPYWIDQQHAIAVAAPRYQNNKLTGAALQLFAANGSMRELAPALENPFVVPTPDRRGMTILTPQQPGQPQVLAADGSAAPVALPSIARTAADAAPRSFGLAFDPWFTPRFVWRPDGSRLLVYTQDTILLLNPATQERCTLDLGSSDRRQRWALKAAWSPDGRYLALNTAIERERGRIRNIEFTIIDTLNGYNTQLNLPFTLNKGFIWMPNSKQLLILGKTGTTSIGAGQAQLFLADLDTQQTLSVFPKQFFGFFSYESEDGVMSLSSDGQVLALQCIVPDKSNQKDICVVDITIR